MADCNYMGRFLQICISNLDKLAIQKTKKSTGNNISFIRKTIKSSFMKKHRSKAAQIAKGFI